jgi:hypothetical protein
VQGHHSSLSTPSTSSCHSTTKRVPVSAGSSTRAKQAFSPAVRGEEIGTAAGLAGMGAAATAVAAAGAASFSGETAVAVSAAAAVSATELAGS